MVFRSQVRNPEERQAYDKLVETCLCFGSEENVAQLANAELELSYVFKDFRKQVDRFQENIFQEPMAVFIAIWADSIRKDKAYAVQHLKLMCNLIEEKWISLKKLGHFARLNHSSVIESIRSFETWTIKKREEAILLYTSFSSWLMQETFGCVSEAVDRDRMISQKRQVSFNTYVDILERLDLREQILAKMFYLGGNRGLEEVLSVTIEDIDFVRGNIHLLEKISYPRHLFEDIKKYMQDRKKGYLFEGKKGERIAHTTPFRALKKVVIELKLDPEFTFKDLTR